MIAIAKFGAYGPAQLLRSTWLPGLGCCGCASTTAASSPKPVGNCVAIELKVRLALIETDVRYDAEAAVVDFSVVVVFEAIATDPEAWMLFRRELPDKLRAVEATIICISQNTANR